MPIKHKKTATGADNGSEIQKAEWNDDHTLPTPDEIGTNPFHGIARTAGALLALPQTVTTVFTLGATANPLDYYFNGTKVSVVSDQSTTTFVGQTAGLYYVYFNAKLGTISFGAFPGLTTSSNVVIASVLWNGSTLGLVQDEMHQHDRNLIVHLEDHSTTGCRYASGLDVTLTANSMTVSTGVINDDGMPFTVPASSAFPTANAYRIFYQTGASAYSFDSTVSTLPYKADAGNSNRPQYVRNDTYALVTLNNATNRYLNFFCYAVTDKHTPIYVFAETASNATLGVTGYTSLTAARAVSWPNLSNMGLSREMRPIHRIIVRADGQVQLYAAQDDYRTVSSLPMAAGTAATSANIVTETNYGNVQTALDQLAGFDTANVKLTGDQTIAGTKTFSSPVLISNTTASSTKDTGCLIVEGGIGVEKTVTSGGLNLVTTAANESATLGSELLTGGTWTSTGWTGDEVNGWTHTAGNTSALTYSATVTAGSYYHIRVTRSGTATGTATFTIGGAVTGTISAANGVYQHSPKATATTGLTITPISTFVGTIVVSVKQITAISTPINTVTDSTGAISNETRINTNALGNIFNGVGSGSYITTGTYNNVGGGYQALNFVTSGYSNNVGAGYRSLFSVTTGTYNNVGAGHQSLLSLTTGSYNSVGAGYRALYSLTTGFRNSVGAGHSALYYLAGGSSYNHADGHQAGMFIADGTTALATANYCTFVGVDTKALADSASNETVIGYNAIGAGSNSVTIGNTSVTTTVLRGVVTTPAVVTTQRTVTDANATMVATDYTIRMSTGASNRTVDLAAAVAGQIVVVKKIDSGAGVVTFICNAGTCTIDGITTRSLSSQYESLTLQCVTVSGNDRTFDII